MKDKPEILNVRLTIPNKVFINELKLLHKSENISEVVRKLFHNVEELFRHNIDIHDVHTIKKIIKEM